MRLIDADELRKPVWAEEDNITGYTMSDDERAGYNDGLYKMWNEIKTAPVIRIDKPKGEWIWNETDYGYQCSVCHCFWDYNGSYAVFDKGAACYCPNCGAEMKGEYHYG